MNRILGPVRGVLLALLVCLHTLFFGAIIFVIMPLKFLTWGRVRSRMVQAMEWVAQGVSRRRPQCGLGRSIIRWKEEKGCT